MQLPSLLGHVQELLTLIFDARHGPRSQPPDAMIDSFFRARKYLGSHDRRFIAETTYGTLRHLRRCEYIVLSSVPRPSLPRGDRALLLALAYLLHMEHQQVQQADGLANKFVSKDLRAHLTELLIRLSSFALPSHVDPVERLALAYSFPDWMVRRFLHGFGPEETEQLLSSLNQPASLQLRVNTLKTTVEDCQHRLEKEGLKSNRTKFSSVGLEVAKRVNIFDFATFRDGLFEVQDEGSQLLPVIVDPKPTDKVLDACAGAGGKTLAFADIMRGRGEILATDLHDFRLRELKKRARRAGVQNVRIQRLSNLDELNEKYTEHFDIVFLDVPCSGLGTIRRNPGMKWSVSEESVRELSAKQRSILESTWRLVKPGGRMVYATCTFLPDENEFVVEDFVREHPEFQLLDLAERAKSFGLRTRGDDRYITLLPHVHGTDGFFCSIMKSRRK
jgi:16S rRNA (cytosine967-C5)-methyltransferase